MRKRVTHSNAEISVGSFCFLSVLKMVTNLLNTILEFTPFLYNFEIGSFHSFTVNSFRNFMVTNFQNFISPVSTLYSIFLYPVVLKSPISAFFNLCIQIPPIKIKMTYTFGQFMTMFSSVGGLYFYCTEMSFMLLCTSDFKVFL